MATVSPTNDAQRPKTPKRRKISIACEACRTRKARCNGEKPQCGNCVQRLEKCVYRVLNTSHAETHQYIDSLVNRISDLERQKQHPRSTPDSTSTIPRPNDMDPAISNPTLRVLDSVDSTAEGNALVRNSTGGLPDEAEAVISLLNDASCSVDAMGGNADMDAPTADGRFYGTSSATSFMKEFRGMISPQSDRTSPETTTRDYLHTQKQRMQARKPFAGLLPGGPDMFNLMPRATTDLFLDLYWDRAYIIFPYLHRPTFMTAYERLWSPATVINEVDQPGLGLGGCERSGPTSAVFHCALNAMLVLGVQFSDMSLEDRSALSNTLMHRSRSHFDLDMFDSGSIEAVQALLLLVQIFQFTTFPTRCWSAMGAACRLAQGLGLHIPEHRVRHPMSIEEVELRKRLWHSCSMLDAIVSMTLGRPTMLHPGHEVELPSAVDDVHEESEALHTTNQPSTYPFFIQAVRLSRILSRILSQVYKEVARDNVELRTSYGSFDLLIELDLELERFRKQIPDILCWDETTREPVLNTSSAQRNVLRARYWHLKVLLYRQAFTQFCRSHSVPHGTHASSEGLGPISLQWSPADSFAHCCAVNCVQAAIELVNVTYEHAGTKATGSWWYNMFYTRTAAMVVLFANICPNLRDFLGRSKLAATYQRCEEILREKLPQDVTVRSCLSTLRKLHEQILQPPSEPNTLVPSGVLNQESSWMGNPNAPDYSFFNAEMGHAGNIFDGLWDSGTFNFAIDEFGTSLL